MVQEGIGDASSSQVRTMWKKKKTDKDESLEATRKDILRWIAHCADNLATLARLETSHDIIKGEVARLTRRLDKLKTVEGPDAEAAEEARLAHWAEEGHRLANEAQAEWGIAILRRRGQKKSWFLRWWK